MASLDAVELVRLVRDAGGDLVLLEEGRLEIRDPRKRVSREMRDAIRANKGAVLDLLIEREGTSEDARAAYVRNALAGVAQRVSCHALADPGEVIARLWETMSGSLDEAERNARALGALYQEGKASDSAAFDEAVAALGRRWTEALDALDRSCHTCGEERTVVLVDIDGDRMCHRCLTTPPGPDFRGRRF